MKFGLVCQPKKLVNEFKIYPILVSMIGGFIDFILKVNYYLRAQLIRIFYTRIILRIQGVAIGKGTFISSVYFSWPHKVRIGANCIIEHAVFFKHDGPLTIGKSIIIGDKVFIGNNCEFNIKSKIEIGNHCLIASGCKFIDHDHGMALGKPMHQQDCSAATIVLEEDVWLGVNVVVLKGVRIGKGAVVAAGAVVNKFIPPLEIWGGIPAKKIGHRGA
jgi:acetyltransferase-like isoleucine patch superfamily enzyme